MISLIMSDTIHNVIIIWSGPAGHTAAIYTWRALLEPLMFEGRLAWWVAAWGQLTTTTEVENYPWFAKWIDGTALMMEMRQQSINSWCEIQTKTVDSVVLSDDPAEVPHKVIVGKHEFLTRTIIIATGATAKRLWLPWEEIYRQRGVSACAVCDGALPIFRDKVLVVIWWGDSACEEANYLTKYASKVIMLVRRDEFRASKVMGERTKKNPKIDIMRHTEWVEILGDEKVMTWMKIVNNQTKEESEITAWGLFYAIGHKPNTSFLDEQVETDEAWYIITYGRLCEEIVSWKIQISEEKKQKLQDWSHRFYTSTSKRWVFASGDVQDKTYRQAITSAGTWCMAAIEAEHYLASIEN